MKVFSGAGRAFSSSLSCSQKNAPYREQFAPLTQILPQQLILVNLLTFFGRCERKKQVEERGKMCSG
jgi:hypothetical protein